MKFGEYVVFVYESGDHSSTSINGEYPVFVLAFCVFEKVRYADRVLPAVTRLKFQHFGHNTAVLHEHDIRKQTGAFAILTDRAVRARFLDNLNGLMTETEFS